jgi:hypothetical protein
MLSWLRHPRESIERIDAEADAFIHNLGAAPIPLRAGASMRPVPTRW